MRGPVGLILAPDGNLLTTNGDAVNIDPNQPSELIEFSRCGKFLGERSIDSAEGAAYGLATTGTKHVTLMTGSDDTNALDERFVTN